MYGVKRQLRGVDFSPSTMWILGLKLVRLGGKHPPTGPSCWPQFFFFKLGKPENDGDRWESVLLKCLLLFLVSTFISNIVPIDDLRNQLSAFRQVLR